jgi:hypothetical protein
MRNAWETGSYSTHFVYYKKSGGDGVSIPSAVLLLFD